MQIVKTIIYIFANALFSDDRLSYGNKTIFAPLIAILFTMKEFLLFIRKFEQLNSLLAMFWETIWDLIPYLVSQKNSWQIIIAVYVDRIKTK